MQAGLARSESEGQRRMLALHGGREGVLPRPAAPGLWRHPAGKGDAATAPTASGAPTRPTRPTQPTEPAVLAPFAS